MKCLKLLKMDFLSIIVNAVLWNWKCDVKKCDGFLYPNAVPDWVKEGTLLKVLKGYT